MSAPFTSNGSGSAPRRPGRAGQSRRGACRREHAGGPFRPRSFCRRSASQAPPEAMPARWVWWGCSMLRTPRSSSRYSASASRLEPPACHCVCCAAPRGRAARRKILRLPAWEGCSWKTPQKLFQDDAGRRRVGILGTARHGLRWCCSARPPRTPAGRSARAAGGQI
jgi:hypothetical protein